MKNSSIIKYIKPENNLLSHPQAEVGCLRLYNLNMAQMQLFVRTAKIRNQIFVIFRRNPRKAAHQIDGPDMD